MASAYLKNTITLLSGIGIGQVLSLASLPLLTRLYSSAELGTYFLVYAAAGIGAALFSLQSHLSIVRGRNSTEAHKNLSLSLAINTASHLLLMAACALVYQTHLLQAMFDKAGVILLYGPVLSYLVSTQLSFDAFYNQKQDYQKLKRLKIARSAIMVGLQIILPWLMDGANAHYLIMAQITALALVMCFNWIETKPTIFITNPGTWRNYWVGQKDILLYNTGLSMVNTVTTNLPYLLISYFFGAATTGHYGMAHRIVGMPLNLFGESLGVVFYQKGAQLKNHSRKIKPLFMRTLSMLTKFGIAPVLILLLFAKTLLVLILGKEWESTGTMLQIMAPWLFLVYINSAVSYLISILQFQKQWIWNEVAHLVFRTAALWCGFAYFHSATLSIVLLSAVSVVFNCYFLYVFASRIKYYELSIK